MNVTLEELKAEVLQNPEVQAEYERLRPEFELAETIIAARTAQGLTQAELAARMKTSQSYVARLESGRVLPSMRRLTNSGQRSVAGSQTTSLRPA